MSYIAQIALERKTGLPEDVSINVMHFASTTVDQAGATNILNRLSAFYVSQQLRMSPLLTGQANVKFFDTLDPSPRVPKFTGSFTFAPSATLADALVEEAAICISIKAAVESGQSAARRRGRIFLGPLHKSPIEIVNNRVRVSNIARLSIAQNMPALIGSGNDVPLAVYSVMDQAARPVQSGYVDDAFDTIRSRGPSATLRTTFVKAP